MNPLRSIWNVLRWLAEVVSPRRTARAVPLGRLAIAMTFIAATIFVLYSLDKDRFALPWISERYTIQAEFDDAAGLDAANEPPVAVAGVPAGKVVDVVYTRGRALVTLELEEGVRGKVFRDASVRARPLNAANILAVNVTPGTPEAGALPEGGVIRARRSSIPVASDEVLGMLDADTRAYLRIIIGESAGALDGRSGELGTLMRRAGKLTDSGRQVAALLRERRRLTRALVGDLDRILQATARRGDELATVVGAAARILETSGGRERELADSLRQLPTFLSESRSAFAAVRGSETVVRDALDRLAPAARTLVPALRSTRRLVPVLDTLMTAAARLGRDGRGPDAELRSFLARLNDNTAPLEQGLADLTELVRGFDGRKEGVRRTADVLSGALSTQDRHGPIARFKLTSIEPPRPEHFGLPASAGRRGGGAEHSLLERRLASVLTRMCRRESGGLACLLRYMAPGLQGSLLSRSGKPVARGGGR